MSYDDDVHPYSDLLLGRVDAVRARQRARRSRHAAQHRPGHRMPDALATGHYVIITAPENVALRDQVDAILRERHARRHARAIFRKWNVWNDDQPRSMRELAGRSTLGTPGTPAAETPARGTGTHDARPSAVAVSRGARSRWCCRAWPWRWPSCSACRSPSAASTAIRVARFVADRLRRGDARHAGAAAAVRALLRPRRRVDPPAGVHRRPARARLELRRLRERDLSQRARSGAARPARCRAHSRLHASGRRCA